MTEFTYKALDSRGQFVTGQLSALSLSAATRHLTELGYVPLSTTSNERGHWAWSDLLPRSRVSKRDVTVLLQDLGLLLGSGLPLEEGLKLLSENASPAAASLITQLVRSIGSGANFSEALQAHPATALPDLIAVVRSAEATGNLQRALEGIAQERMKQEKISAKLRSAIRYPIFLVVVSQAVLLFFLLFVVPQFAAVVQDYGTRPDSLVATVIALSTALRNNGDLILALVVALFGAAVLAWRLPRIRAGIQRTLSKLPIVNGVLSLRRTSKFCRSLATLLSSGVMLPDALRLMSESDAGNECFVLVLDRVRRGGRLVDAVAGTNLVAPLAARMLRVGEESGALDVAASRSALYYESKLEEQIERLTGIVGPAAIVLIAGVIGTLIVSIMSTLLSINQMVM